MIAFYIVGLSMKTMRNALFVDSTNSIIEKMAVMTRTTTKEKVGLKGVLILSYHCRLKRWFTNKKESELF
jgi:hypothetical protein